VSRARFSILATSLRGLRCLLADNQIPEVLIGTPLKCRHQVIVMQHVHLFCGFYSLNESSQWRLAVAPTMKSDLPL
jgi:hypothetical protein